MDSEDDFDRLSAKSPSSSIDTDSIREVSEPGKSLDADGADSGTVELDAVGTSIFEFLLDRRSPPIPESVGGFGLTNFSKALFTQNSVIGWLASKENTSMLLRLPAGLESAFCFGALTKHLATLTEHLPLRGSPDNRCMTRIIVHSTESAHNERRRQHLLASICHQILQNLTQMDAKVWLQRRTVDDLSLALRGLNHAWRERVLWGVLRELLTCRLFTQHIIAVTLCGADSSFTDEIKVLGGLLDFFACTQFPMKLLVILSDEKNIELEGDFSLEVKLESAELKDALLDDYRCWLDAATQAIPSLKAQEDLILSNITSHYQNPLLIISYLHYLGSRTWITKHQLEADSKLFTKPETFFLSVLDMVRPIHRGLVINALRLVIYAARRLTMAELATALTVKCAGIDSYSLDQQLPLNITHFVRSVLAGLIVEHKDTLYILNCSLQAILEGPKEQSTPEWVVTGLNADMELAIICLRYLSIWKGSRGDKTVESSDVSSDKWPFLYYAVKYWHRHFQRAMKSGGGYDEIQPFVEDWELIKSWMKLWLQIHPGEMRDVSSPEPSSSLRPTEISTVFNIDIPLAVEASLLATRSLSLMDGDETPAALWAVWQLVADKTIHSLQTWPERFPKSAVLPRLLQVFPRAPVETFRLLEEADQGFITEHARTLLLPALNQGVTTIIEYCIPLIATPEELYGLPWLSCATYGYTSLLKVLYDAYPSLIHYQDPCQRNALHHAIRFGHFEAVELLLQWNVNVNQADVKKDTPVLLACAHGYLNILRRLLREEVDLSQSDYDHNNGLHTACYLGLTDIANLLIDSGVSMTTKNSSGDAPLYKAIDQDRVDLIRRILHTLTTKTGMLDSLPPSPTTEDDDKSSIRESQGQKEMIISEVQNTWGQNALQYAAIGGKVEIVTLLLEHVSKDMINTYCLVHHAAEGGHLSLVKRLLQFDGVDINQEDSCNRTPLQLASVFGHVGIVEELVNRGSSTLTMDGWGDSPLDDAVRYGYEDVVRVLLGQKKPDDIRLGRLLISASSQGYAEIVTLLLDVGAPKEFKAEDQRRPIHAAAYAGYDDVIRILLLRQVKLDTRDDKGYTPLTAAASRGNISSTMLLLDAGAYIEALDDEGWSPIQRAALGDHLDVVQLLLEKGAILNPGADKSGAEFLEELTSLGYSDTFEALWDHYEQLDPKSMSRCFDIALHKNNYRMVSFLLDKGVSLDASDGTALQQCAFKGNLAMAKTLLEHATHAVDVNETNDQMHTALIASVVNRKPRWMLTKRRDKADLDKIINKQCKMVEYLLKMGADTEVAIGEYGTFINACIAQAYFEVLQFVVEEMKIPINSSDNQGRTPAHMLALCLRPEDVDKKMDLLLNHGLERIIGKRDKQGRKPLHLVGGTYNVDVAERLLKLRKGVNATDNDGWTPLHWACRGEDTNMIGLLIRREASIDARTNENWAPWHVAVYHNRLDLADILGSEKFSEEDDPNLPKEPSLRFTGVRCDSCYLSVCDPLS